MKFLKLLLLCFSFFANCYAYEYKTHEGETVTIRDFEQYQIRQVRKNSKILEINYRKKNGASLTSKEIETLLEKNGSSWRRAPNFIYPKWVNSNGITAVSYTNSLTIDHSANEPYPQITTTRKQSSANPFPEFSTQSFLDQLKEIEKSYNRELIRQRQRELQLEKEIKEATKQIEFVVTCWLIGTAVFFLATLILIIVLIRFLIKKTKQIDELKKEKAAWLETMAKTSKQEPVYDENDHRRWMPKN